MTRRPRNTISSETIGVAFLVLFAVSLLLGAVGAEITHIVNCIETSQWVLLIAGAIAPPVGVIHGIGIWMGWCA